MVRIIRQQEVSKLTGKQKSSLYRDINLGLMTPPINIGARAVGWFDDEINAINSARVSGKTNCEIRDLVKKLIENRKTIGQVEVNA